MKHRILLLGMTLLTLASCTKNDDAENLESVFKIEEVVFSFEQDIFSDITSPYKKAIIASTENEGAALILYLHDGTARETTIPHK